MERKNPLPLRILDRLRSRAMFWRILLLYLGCSVLLLGVFSAVLTGILTRHAAANTIARDNDALSQAYAAAEYVLNTTYDVYYKMYATSDVSDLLFDTITPTAEADLAAGRLLAQITANSDCVASVYLVNRGRDRVWASDGTISTIDDFWDTQAIRLFQFYNENSNTLFLPRTATLPDNGRGAFITLIFSRRNAVSVPMGGLIVNLDEAKLSRIIAGELDNAEDLYVISENGSILVNADAGKVNTSIYGSELWEKLSACSGQERFSFQAVVDDVPCLVTGRNASRLRFCFLRITPRSDLEASVAYIRNVALVCAAVFLGAAFLLAAAGSRYVYRPISHLITDLRAKTDGPAAPLDEVAFLDSAYRNLFQKVENLSHDNDLMERARRREILLHLLHGDYPTEEKCRAEASRLGLRPGQYNRAIVLLLDDFKTLQLQTVNQDLALYRYALCNVAEELLAGCGTPFGVEISGDEVAILLVTDSPAPPETLTEALNRVVEAMRQHLHCSVSAGIGTISADLTALVTSYNAAMTACGYRLVFGRGAVIRYEAIAERQSAALDYPMEEDLAIVQALRSRNQPKTLAGLDAFFTAIAEANIDGINMATTQLSISLSRAVHSLAAGHEGTRSLPNYRVLSDRMQEADTLQQRCQVLKAYCIRVIEIRNSEVQNEREHLIERVRDFIEANYGNPMLNTDDIAGFAGLSPNYLRTVFKQAVGKSPTDYLTDCRIRHAKELLADTDLSTKEIAAAVGYYNHRYFYSVFKSKTGATASAYRAEQRGRAVLTEGKEAAADEERDEA